MRNISSQTNPHKPNLHDVVGVRRHLRRPLCPTDELSSPTALRKHLELAELDEDAFDAQLARPLRLRVVAPAPHPNSQPTRQDLDEYRQLMEHEERYHDAREEDERQDREQQMDEQAIRQGRA